MLNIARSLFVKRAILLPLYTFSSYFSGQTKEQKELAAKEAAQIIRFLGKDRQQISLDNFIPLTAAIKTKLNIQSKLINDMLDPRIGIILPDHLRTQERITDALNISNTRDLKGFTFFPNRIVTSQIFQQILLQTSQKLIHGPAGSSKTVSFTLYTCLSQIINQYEFQFDEVIAQDIPRMFYLNYYNPKFKNTIILDKNNLKELEQQIQERIINNIKSNLPKKMSDKFQNLTKVSELSRLIRSQFIDKRKLKINFIFDQFNKYISEVRQYNSAVLLQKKPNLTLQLQKQKLSFESGIWFENANNLCINKVFYNSSQNIQDRLLKKIPQPQFSFSIYTHTPLHKRQINFYQQIQLPQGKREMISILFFELKRLCPSKHLQKITQIEKIFFKNFEENLKDLSKDIIFTHFQIRQYFNKKKETLKLLRPEQNLSTKDIEKIKQIINEIFQQNIKNLVDQVKNFCFKAKQSVSLKTYKIKLLMAVRTIIQRRLRNPVSDKRSEKVKNVNQLTIQQIKYQLGVDQKMYKIDTATIDKNLFEFENQIDEDYNKWVRIKWSSQYFLKLSNFVDEALRVVIKQNTQMFLNAFFKHFRDYNAGVGILFDKIITESIEKQPILFKFQSQQTQIQIFNLKKSLRFLHFNAYPLFEGLQQRFGQFITESKMHKWIAGVPKTRSQKKSINSQSVDLLIFEKKNNGDYTIYSFDFTVMNQIINNTSLKFTDSKNCLEKVYQNYYGKIQKQNGGILTPKQQIIKSRLQNYRKKSKKLNIANWVHTIICNQPKYYSQSFKIKIPYKRQYGMIKIQTSNVQDFTIQFSKESDLAAQNSLIFKRIISQLKK